MKMITGIALLSIVLSSCSPKLSPDYNWNGNRWVLTELKGVPVQQSGTNRDAYIEFMTSEKRFSGNGGCNRIGGNYTLKGKSEINFGGVASTKMSCPDITFETAFLETLNNVNRYQIDGNNMYLKNGNKILFILQRK